MGRRIHPGLGTARLPSPAPRDLQDLVVYPGVNPTTCARNPAKSDDRASDRRCARPRGRLGVRLQPTSPGPARIVAPCAPATTPICCGSPPRSCACAPGGETGHRRTLARGVSYRCHPNHRDSADFISDLPRFGFTVGSSRYLDHSPARNSGGVGRGSRLARVDLASFSAIARSGWTDHGEYRHADVDLAGLCGPSPRSGLDAKGPDSRCYQLDAALAPADNLASGFVRSYRQRARSESRAPTISSVSGLA